MSLLEAVPIWIGAIGTAGAVIAGVAEYRNEHRRRVLATASAIPTVLPGQRMQSSSPTLSTNGGGRRLKPNRGVPGFAEPTRTTDRARQHPRLVSRPSEAVATTDQTNKRLCCDPHGRPLDHQGSNLRPHPYQGRGDSAEERLGRRPSRQRSWPVGVDDAACSMARDRRRTDQYWREPRRGVAEGNPSATPDGTRRRIPVSPARRRILAIRAYIQRVVTSLRSGPAGRATSRSWPLPAENPTPAEVVTVSRPVSGVLSSARGRPGGHPSKRPTWGHVAGPAVPDSALLRVGVASRPGRPGRWCALTAPFHPCLCGPGPSARNRHRRSVLCCPIRQVTPSWLSPAPCPAESRLSSARSSAEAGERTAATRPTHRRLPVCQVRALVTTSTEGCLKLHPHRFVGRRLFRIFHGMKRAQAHARAARGLAAAALGSGLGLVLAFSAPASASPRVAEPTAQVECADPGHSGIPECATTTTVDPGTTTTLGRSQPAPPAARPADPGGLAFTGGDLAGFAVIGAAVTAAGVALTVAGRRRARPVPVRTGSSS
jgi:hypothetical protein